MDTRTDYQDSTRGSLMRRLLGTLARRRSTLVSLAEAKDGEVCYGQRYLGLQPVPLSAVSGTVGRAGDFDRNFRPITSHTRERWVRVNQAFADGKSLPPVSLYKFGDFYFVKDGNHRVSVAKHNRAEYIDAEVTEFIANPH